MSTAKKKRRRSSLSAAKMKLEISPALGKDLHLQIDQSLPAEKRLEQLTSICLRFAVDKISLETESQETKDQLQAVLQEVPETLAQDGLQEAFHNACHIGQRLPNPINITMDETAREIEARIAKLKQEEQDWYDYFKDLETRTAEAERKASEKTMPASELSATQRELAQDYLVAWANLDMVGQQVTDASNKATLLVCEHEKNLHTFSQVKTQVNRRLDKKLQQLHEKSCGNIGSPKAKIQNIMAFPTPPSEPSVGQ